MSLNSFYIELTTKCTNCGDIIAINAAVKKVWCSNCNGETKLNNEFYNLFFGEADQLAHKMSIGEEHKTVTEDKSKGLARFVFKKRPAACSNCKAPLPLPGMDDSELVCSNCSYKHIVRKHKGKKDKTYLLLGEYEYQIAEAEKQTILNDPVEFECTNCAGAMKSDGSERMCECPYCSSKIMIPDALWYRLHPSAHLQPWYLLINKDNEGKQKPWEFEEVIDMCYKDKLLYCFGENRHGDYAVWAMTINYELIWMKVLPEEEIDKRMYSRIEYLEKSKLLVWSDDLPSVLIYDAKNGDFIEEVGGYEPHDADKHYLDLTDCDSLATDPDGSIVALINERIVRFNAKGEGISTWPDRKNLFGMTIKEDLEPLYKNAPEPVRPAYKRRKNKGKYIHANKLKDRSLIYPSAGGKPTVQIDHKRNMYILCPMQLNALRNVVGGSLLTKFDPEGEIVYKAELPNYGVNMVQPQIDEQGNVYIMLNDVTVEMEEGGCMFKVYADGKQVKEITRTHYSILHNQSTSFVVDELGNIYTCNDSAEIRNYNNEGKLIHRNKNAIEKDKEILEG